MPPVRIPVVVFLTSFEAGGTEHQMIELTRRLDRGRFEVHLACFHRRGEWVARAEEGADSVREFPIRGFGHPTTLGQAAAFGRWCRERKIAVLQACDLYTNIFALPAAAVAGVPVRLGSRRGLNPDRSRFHRVAQQAAYRFAQKVVVNSTAVAEALRRSGLPAGRVAVIPNGLEISRFPDVGGRAIRRVGTVARLHPVKGLDVFLESVALARQDLPHLEATIVGDGALRSELERQAHALGLADAVRFAGHREDVPAALAEMDLFVLPSRSEAFPNALIEAMASALPVVATAVGGVPELVEDGRNGVLVPAGRPDRLAQAMVEMVRQPERAVEMGRRARADVFERFSFDRMVAQFETLYLALAAKKRVAGAEAAAVTVAPGTRQVAAR